MRKQLTVLALVLASFLARGAATQYETVDGVRWAYTVTNGEATIGPGNMTPAVDAATSGALRVPEEIGGCPVVALSKWCFLKCPNITSVDVPDCVRSIGYLCFGYCTALESVRLPAGLTATPDSLFMGCTALKSAEIPQGVTSFGRDCFWCCTSLTNAVIPRTLTVLPAMTFYKCESLAEIELPPNLTELGVNSLGSCSSLKSIAIPESVTVLRQSAFSWCTSLQEIDLPDSVSVIESGAFEKCESMTEFKFPLALTRVERIFGRCTGLTSMTVPKGVVSVAEGAFCDCTGVERFEVEEGNEVFRTLDGVLCEGDKLIAWPKNKRPYVIPDGIREIGGYVFQNNLDVSSLVIPEGVEVIGPYMAFHTSLTSIKLPSTLRRIEDCAFRWCYLSSVEIPAATEYIGRGAFSICDSLRSVTIRHPNVTIGDTVFDGDSSLSEFVLADKAVSVGTDAFRGCSRLRIPTGATSLPVDLNGRREGRPETVAEWRFEKSPGEYRWYSPSDFGLVGDAEDELSWNEYDPRVEHDNYAYVEIDARNDIRFPFEADLGAHDIVLSFKARLHPKEEPPPIVEPPRPEIPDLKVIVIRQDFEVGVRGRFLLFTVVDDPENPTDVRLGIVSDRVYLTDFSPSWTRNGYNMPKVDWCDFTIRMDENGFTVSCNEKPICSGKTEKFPYYDASAGTKVDGMSVLGYGQIDEVKVESVPVKADVVLPREMAWGPDPCAPEVTVVDPVAGALLNGVDYTVSVTDNTAVGTAHVMVTGIGFYAGTIEKTFEVVKAQVEVPEALSGVWHWEPMRSLPFVYDGRPGGLAFFVSNVVTKTEIAIGGTTNAVNAGNYTATAKGRLLRIVPGEYSDTVYVTEVDSRFDWSILRKPISSDGIVIEAGTTNHWATGIYIPAPRPTSVFDRDLGRTLTYGTDYTYSGANMRKDPGIYTITVAGMGNYSGYARYSWTIVNPASSTTIEGVSVPNAWLKEKGIPISDGVEAALSAQTGKTTSSGHPLSVWEEYVQGTDPNDPDDRFEANVTIVDGKPVVTYTPDLGEERTYTILGSTDLKTWKPAEEGDGSRYFKVKVDLK